MNNVRPIVHLKFIEFADTYFFIFRRCMKLVKQCDLKQYQGCRFYTTQCLRLYIDVWLSPIMFVLKVKCIVPDEEDSWYKIHKLVSLNEQVYHLKMVLDWPLVFKVKNAVPTIIISYQSNCMSQSTSVIRKKFPPSCSSWSWSCLETFVKP